MAAPQKNTIDHFTHLGHPLTAVDGHKQQYLCNGCKTPGSGKRYRCNGCDFDLHEYCGTCPEADTLSTFMHQNHTLLLVTPTGNIARHVNRFCSVCTDPVDGLFYRCLDCDFDAHPLCTQLPKELKHALHIIHPLNLESSPVAGVCAVCKCLCTGWRYRCGVCHFDIHLGCILVVPCPENNNNNNVQANQRGVHVHDQGIPFRGPPQFGPYYGSPYGPGYCYHPFGPGYCYRPFGAGYCYHPLGPGFNNTHPNQYMYPNNSMPQNQVGGGSGSTGNNGTGRIGKSMFSLVGQLGFGVISNMIFGVDVSSLFVG
ncbi:hypothetical protein DH2020_046020 [Rehmannia glutinosa]|uniref:Phorbol-ester/DAG-type domain-containing protein n=1 Tax=Rehmannia glutinosa TaxID=99300 RepID=A0ABR0UDC1_REHGL